MTPEMTEPRRTMMNRRTFMSVVAAVSVATGLAALLAPGQISSVFGVTLDDVGASVTRLLGAAYLGYAPIVWFARDVRDGAAQRAIAMGNFVSWALSLIVIVMAITTGLGGTPSWLLAAMAVVFAAGWGYFAFIDRADVAVTKHAST
jgi:hypothetical protein